MKPLPKKRGAIELSMTTIIIVVIGVTMLTLGLRWIGGLFSDIEKQRQQIIEATEQQIREQFGESSDPINLLTKAISVKQGSFTDLGVGIKNTYSETHKFQYTVDLIEPPSGVTTQQLIWIKWDKTVLTLSSGELYSDIVSIDPPKKIPIGAYRFKINLKCLDCSTEIESSAPFTLRVT